MHNLEHYTREMKAVAREAAANGSKIKGSHIAWIMMIIGVVVTGTMTYALTRKGMNSSYLWEKWANIAAFLPVLLLEGSAIALVYGRHHWFRSTEQRQAAGFAGWAIWVILGATSIVHFAFGESKDGTVQFLMSGYASYVLPLVIVAVPMLWKHLYDAAPDSQTRVAVLEAEAELKTGLVSVMKEQNQLMIDAYRDSLQTPRVTEARRALFEQASIEHAKDVVGFIDGASDHLPMEKQKTLPYRPVNGKDYEEYEGKQ